MIPEPTASEGPPPLPAPPVYLPIAYAPAEDDRALHPATIVVQVVRFLRSIGFLIAIAVFFRVTGRAQGVQSIEWLAAGLGSLGITAAVLRYLSFRYAVRDGALHVSSGILTRTRRTIPLERIQNINVKRELIHRMMGVADVRIETASGGHAEAELSVVGLDEAEAIRAALSGHAIATEASQELVADAVVYRARPVDLLVAGATRNRAGGVVAAAFGLLVYAQGVLGHSSDAARSLERAAQRFSVPGWSAIALAGGALVLVGWLASIVTTVVGRWGFVLTRSPAGQLRREFGLLTREASIFPAERVQMLRVVEPFLQRRVGLCRLDAETAGSFAPEAKRHEGGGTAELCPILRRREAGAMARLVLPALSIDGVDWLRQHPLARRRVMIRGCVGLSVFVVALSAWSNWWALFGLAFVPPLAFARAWLIYRATGYAIDGRYLVVRRGPFTRETRAVPLAKVQATFVTQSPLQRRLRLATLSVWTAGTSFGGRVSVPDLGADVAVALQDAIRRASRPDSAEVDNLSRRNG